MYVRDPSDNRDTLIFLFSDDNVAKDFLADPGHKKYFGLWKKGQDVTYELFEEAVAQEQEPRENT